MKKFLALGSALVVSAGLATSAQAFEPGDVLGELVDQGDNTFDFVITNNSSDDIVGVDFSFNTGFGFSGNFANLAGITFGLTDFSALGLTETQVFVDPGSVVSAGVADNATQFGAAFSTIGGVPFIPAGTSATVATLATTDGVAPEPSAFPVFGVVSNFEAELTEITAIPEPTAAALLGLGGLGLIARRRKV